jgi:ADP-ribose pyrophosphatase
MKTRWARVFPNKGLHLWFFIRDFESPKHLQGELIPYIVWMTEQRRTSKARVLSSVEVYRGPVFWITSEQILEPAGVRVRRDIVRHSGSVVILALDESRREPQVLLERQYRHAARQTLWELPAGRVDEGENELTAARRELLEETGYSASRWRCILRFYASPGFLAETMNVYLARGLRRGKAQPEADEVIQIRMLPLSTAVRMVMNGSIRDAKTICGILWLNQTRKRPKAHR